MSPGQHLRLLLWRTVQQPGKREQRQLEQQQVVRRAPRQKRLSHQQRKFEPALASAAAASRLQDHPEVQSCRSSIIQEKLRAFWDQGPQGRRAALRRSLALDASKPLCMARARRMAATCLPGVLASSKDFAVSLAKRNMSGSLPVTIQWRVSARFQAMRSL